MSAQKSPPHFNQILPFLRRHRLELISLGLILLLASILRLYKISEFLVFLGDEGRDALVVKRMIVDHDLTLLGPTASVGGFYLGPVYYYMMIIPMFLTNLDPVGPAVMVALMGISTVALIYLVIRHWFGQFPAQVTSLIYAASPGVINFSRSSWNPNPMPLFSLLTILTLHFGLARKDYRLSFLSALFFGIAIQLHYLGLLLAPIMLVMMLIHTKLNLLFRHLISLAIGFLVGASLYFAFEIRHGFPNIKSVIEFITRSNGAAGPKNWNLPWLFFEVNRFNLESVLGADSAPFTPYLSLALILSVIIFLILVMHSRARLSSPEVTIFTYWLIGSFGMGMYRGHWHYHYFGFLFPVPYLLFGLLLSRISSRPAKLLILTLTISISIFMATTLPIWGQGSNLINQTHQIASTAAALASGKDYNFALITPGNSDHAYRFFLEKDGTPPTPLEQQVTSQLIIVCEQEPDTCEPLGHPLWEIAGFGRAKIDEVRVIHPGISVFRLIHHPDSLDRIGHPAPQG